MCGIIGILKIKESENTIEELVSSLKRMDYRGYDSWGYAVLSDDSLRVEKKVGRITKASLKDKTFVGVGHCLHPDTFVQLSDGTVCKMKDVKTNDGVPTLDFENLKLKKSKCLAMKHESPEELYEIKTPSFSLVCTGEHKMFVASGPTIIEKKVKDLNIKDLILCSSNIKIEGQIQPLQTVPVKRYYKFDKKVIEKFKNFMKTHNLTIKKTAKLLGISESVLEHFLGMDRNLEENHMDKICEFTNIAKDDFIPVDSIHGKNIKLPEKTSKDLLHFLGYLLGDGYVGKRTVRFKDPRKPVLEYYSRVAKELFNLETRIVKIPEANAFLLEMNSKFLCDWLRVNFPEICEKGRKKSIPELIGRTTDEELAGFIKGLFDAEGCCATKSGQITIRMVSENVLRVLQFYLLRFGIQSSFRSYKTAWGQAYGLSMNNHKTISTFINEINFTSTEKQTLAEQILLTMKSGLTFKIKAIPMKKPEISSVLNISSRILKGDTFLTSYAAQKLISELKEQGNKEAVEILSRFLNADINYQEITEIRKFKSDVDYVYDLEVPRTHNFLANGFISHNSRWATHGGVTDENAHPHRDCKEEIAVVHNGIIDNYLELKKDLEEKGHKFRSETDTEVIAHLFEEFEGSLLERGKKVAKKLKGAFAIIVIDNKNPNEMLAIKHESPLIIGKGGYDIIIASDPLAFIEHTQKAYFVEEGDIVLVKRNNSLELEFYNYLEDKEIKHELQTLDWKAESADLKGYSHYMLKEIMEQPYALRNGMNLDDAKILAEKMKGKKVVAVACGTARHAAVIGKHLLHKMAKFQMEVMMAHEFTYFVDDIPNDSVILAVSQSGETADVLEVVRKAKARGLPVISIVNVVSSTLARESSVIFPLDCGPEIAVASTKAFSNQVLAFYLISYALAGKLEQARTSLGRLISVMEKQLPYFDKRSREIAEKIYKKEHAYAIGKGVNFAIALEGALKIKEISYIHAEGMPSGELKHGTLALVEKGTPVILLSPTDYTYSDSISNGLETKARGAFLIGISNKNHPSFDEYIQLEEFEDPIFYPLLAIAPLQLLAYHVAVLLKRDIDKPRNLAKSCTVK